jgi:hypothetical protein
MSRLAVVVCMLSVIALCTAAAPAQTISQSELSPDTIQREPLTQKDERLIEAFVDKNLTLIETGDAKEMKDAREALQEVARSQGVSASFRRFFSRAMIGRLNTLALGHETHRAIVATLIIGNLGTPEAVDALEQTLSLEKSTQRFAAVVGYRSAFQSMASPTSPIAGQAGAMLKQMGNLIETEANPLVLDSCVQTITTAASVGAEFGLPMGDLALTQLVQSVSTRVQGLSTDNADLAFFEPCIKATQDLRGIVVLQTFQERANPQLVRDAGGLCGDIYGYVFRRVRQDRLPIVSPGLDQNAVRDARKLEIAGLRIADDLVRVCKDELGIGAPNNPPVRLSPLIERGTGQGDAQYIRSVMDVIGEGGLLTLPRFGFESDRFLRGG